MNPVSTAVENKPETKVEIVKADAPKFQSTHDFDSYKKLFKAIASDERIEILRLLKQNGEMFAQDIEKHFYMEQSTASHHLNTLLKAGAVKNRKSGRYIYYSLNKTVIDEILLGFMKVV